MSYCPHHVKTGECPVCEDAQPAESQRTDDSTHEIALKVFAVMSAIGVGVILAALTNWMGGLFFGGAYLFVLWRVVLR